MGFLDHPEYGLRPWKRHSIVVTVGGLVYIAFGLMIILTWTDDGPRANNMSAGLLVAPMDFWGYLTIWSGLMAVVSSRWPAFHERWGYIALTGNAGVWGAIYLGGLFFDANAMSEATAGLLWGLIGFMWWGISGLMNPDKVVVVEVEVPIDGAG